MTRDRPYDEYTHFDLSTVCIHPKKWAGWSARMSTYGGENFMTPKVLNVILSGYQIVWSVFIFRRATRVSVFSVPMERLTFLTMAFLHGVFRICSCGVRT